MTYTKCVKTENNIVVNIILANNIEWCNKNLDGTWIPLYNNIECGIGWTFQNGEFIDKNDYKNLTNIDELKSWIITNELEIEFNNKTIEEIKEEIKIINQEV